MKKLRSSIAVAVVAASAFIASSAATATASQSIVGTFEGSASGIQSFCTSGTMSISGSLNATLIGRGTFAGTVTTSACLFPPFCCGVPSEPYPVDATFVFAGPGGTFTASGSGTGTSNAFPHFDAYEFNIQLTIDSGTRRYQRASGTLAMAFGVAGPLGGDSVVVALGTITGAITPA